MCIENHSLGEWFKRRLKNAELQETARDYDRLCRAYGPERVAETVAAVKWQEQAKKSRNAVKSGGMTGMCGNPV